MLYFFYNLFNSFLYIIKKLKICLFRIFSTRYLISEILYSCDKTTFINRNGDRMKNFNINTKKAFALVLTGFILLNTCSCGKHIMEEDVNNSFTVEKSEERFEINVDESNMVENYFEQEFKQGEISEVADNKQQIEIIENNDIIYSEEDNVIIGEFISIKNKIVDFLNSEDVEFVKNQVKGVFISIVDFLFYDGEINGIKFDDLTEVGKKKVLELVIDIDSCIVNKFPTYKEDIADITKTAYNKASELIKKGADNIKEFSKEKLGEENYNTIMDEKDDLVKYTSDALEIVGNFSSKVWNSAKEKIKNWYEGFRNN